MFLLILVSILVIADFTLLAFDEYMWSVLVLVGGIVGLTWLFSPVSEFVASIGWHTLAFHYLPLYLLVGAGVALMKWVFYNLKVASYIKEYKVKAQKEYKDNPSKIREYFVINLWNQRYNRNVKLWNITKIDYNNDEEFLDAITPKAKKHVSKISVWILQWPFVLISTFIEDVIRKLGKHLASLFDAMFTRLSRLLIRNAAKGL